MCMRDPVKILYVITGLNAGGAEQMLYKLLRSIDQKQFSPYVVSLSDSGVIGARIEKLGVPVYTLEMRGSILRMFRIWRLFQLIRKISPDIVHSWMYHADLIGGCIAKLCRIKKICWTVRHCNLDSDSNKRSTLAVVRICAGLSKIIPERIIFNSEASRQVHIEFGYNPQHTRVIPNGFDLDSFQPDQDSREAFRNDLGVSNEEFIVGMIGRYDQQKNHIGFISSISQVVSEYPNIRFVFAGAGVDEKNPDLMKVINEKQLQNSVFLFGYRTDIPKIMASIDLLALPSIGEAFPNVLGEAMACAIPCVATDVGDSALIIGETGRVVGSGDMAGIAKNIIDIYEMPVSERKKLGVDARKRVSELFEISAVTRQFETVYMELTEKEKGEG